ncbi:hypothetical protein [Pelosinus sp. sgz500959]|uniref:hypothetical protein n=1 Tax=Pelosinus sp. sgz500959 TaxID=3242472 RepID=UPI00366B74DF
MLKTKLIFGITIGIVCISFGVLAATPEVDGDIRIRIQSRTGDANSLMKGTVTITRVRLNADFPIHDQVSLYGRLAVEQAGDKVHNNGLYDTAGVFDRWGMNWKYKNGIVKIGRQDVVIGQEGLVLTTLIDAVGENNQLTGVTAIWKEGENSFKLVGGRLGEGLFQPLPKVKANLYALQVDHKVNQRLSIGATYRQIATIDHYSSAMAGVYLSAYPGVIKTYSLLGSYYLDHKTIGYTEFGYSNAQQYNGGFGLGVAHMIDKKNSYSINYFNQGKNSGLFRNWGAPDFARNISNANTSWIGYALYYRHQMNRKTLLEISDYYEQGNVNSGANQFRVALLTNF